MMKTFEKQAVEIIKSGRFFTAKFIKADGTSRTMTARSGVKKYVKGSRTNYNPADQGNVIVFEVGSGNEPIPNQYRTIKLERLYYIKQGRAITRDITAGYLLDVSR